MEFENGRQADSQTRVATRALSEFVFSILQEGRKGNNGYPRYQLPHRNHENGLFVSSRLLKQKSAFHRNWLAGICLSMDSRSESHVAGSGNGPVDSRPLLIPKSSHAPTGCHFLPAVNSRCALAATILHNPDSKIQSSRDSFLHVS